MFTVKTYLAPSTIHGLGVFLKEPVTAGSTIWEFKPGLDLELDLQYVNSLPEVTKRYLLHYGYISLKSGKLILCGDDARFQNHSDSPLVKELPGDGETPDVASRDIHAGEELTTNYFSFDADALRKLSG